jgi:hypothetical protein
MKSDRRAETRRNKNRNPNGSIESARSANKVNKETTEEQHSKKDGEQWAPKRVEPLMERSQQERRGLNLRESKKTNHEEKSQTESRSENEDKRCQ